MSVEAFLWGASRRVESPREGQILAKTLQRVALLDFLQLYRRVLVQELVHTHVAAANSNLDLVLLDPYGDTLRAEVVNTLALPHEHHFEFVAIRIIVNELSNLLVDRIFLDRHIDRDFTLQV